MGHSDVVAAAQKSIQLKQEQTDGQRLRAWRQTVQTQGLSGEFVLAHQLGRQVADEEQIRMISELFGR